MASSQTVDVTDKTIFRDNVIAMDVDNILIGWPTYEINFTPDTPGPLKLIIRLKDASKLTWHEDESDSEGEETQVGPTIVGKSISTPLADTGMTKEGLDATLVSDPKHCNSFTATPIRLVGIMKDTAPLKRKFVDEDEEEVQWPPRRFRDVPANRPLTAVRVFKTIPAPVGKENAI